MGRGGRTSPPGSTRLPLPEPYKAIAIIVLAAVKLARLTDGTDIRLWVISVIVTVATAVAGSEVELLIVGVGAPPPVPLRLVGLQREATIPRARVA